MQTLDIFVSKTTSGILAGHFNRIYPVRRRGLIGLLLAFGLFLSAAATCFAATIICGTPTNISGDTDVNTSGTTLYAYARGITTASTNVNGVTFTAAAGHVTWGNVIFNANFNGDAAATYASNAVPFSGLSSAYKTVLQGGAYGGAATGTVTLNGLTWGHAYMVQIWANDSRGGALATRTETVTGSNTVTLAYDVIQTGGGVGQYTIGTFVADSTSQTFTLTSSSSVQLNAINVRDNGYVGIQASFTPSRFNLAKYQPVFTDSTNGTQTAAYLTEGFVDDNTCWVSGNTLPHWAQVVFPFPVTVGSAQLAMGLNNASPMSVFYFQYLTNGNWVTVSGSTVVGNTNVERNIVFPTPITATSFRVYDSLDSPIRIRQLALYPPNGPAGYPFGTDFSIDLARKQPAYATTNTYGHWPLLAADGLVDPSSAWETTLVGSNSLLINLQFTNKLGSAHLYSGATGVAPLTNFVLQYWAGSAWANIPGGNVSGNANPALVIPFTTPVTTTQVQLVFTNSGTCAVQELCLFPANSNSGYPLGTGVISNTPVTAKYDTYSDSYYYLSNSAAGQVIVESNGVVVLGTAGLTNWMSQYQVLLNYDTGTYRLINRNTGLCLAGAQLTTNAGAALAEESYSALPDQDWYMQAVDGINFYLVNQFSGLVVDTQNGVPVQNVQTNSANQLWQIALAQIFSKKGIAGAGNFAGADRRVTFNANWCYSWWYSTSAIFPKNFHYFPMDPDTWYRGSTVAGNLWSFQPGWRTSGYSLNVLGYNEPDMVGQADIDATNGAIYYMNDQNLDLPMAGPAAGDVNGTWNQTFYGYITNWGCRVDYLPAHEYPGNNSSASSSIWITPLQTAYNTYGFPMWMTEWSVVDWSGTGNWSEEDNYNAMAEFLWRAESISWLRKYSLFIFQADTNSPMAINPWTRTTPAPRSNSYDTNGNMTPFGELYAAWDDDANVETNKVYFIHNNGTRKRLQNTLGSTANADDIRVDDFSTKWTLQSAGSANLYYIVSLLDGRRLSYNGSSVGFVAAGTTGTAAQWSLSSYQYGWYYLQHPATSKELSLAYNNSTSAATFTMVATTTTTTAVQWRFIATLPPPAWTGYSDTAWTNSGNWSSQQAPMSGQSVTFNELSVTNLNTVLATDFNVASVVVIAPAGPVAIGGTNTLTVGSGIDLSAASQNLTITAPVAMGANQSWNIASGQTLSVNGGVFDNGGGFNLNVTGSGTVSLGGAATYNGGTIINTNCILQLSASNILPNGISPASNSGDITNKGTLDLYGTAQAINGLNGSGIVDNTGIGVASLTIGANNDGGTFTGIIQDTGGNLTLVKNGSGTESLNSTNTYSGGTIINSGAISIGTNFCLGNGTVTVNSGGQIFNSSKASLTFTNAVTLNGGQLHTGGGNAGTKNIWAGPVTVTASGSSIQSDGTTVGNAFTGGLNMGNNGYTLTVGGNGNNAGSANNFNSVISGGPNATFITSSSGIAYLNAANTYSGADRSGYSLVLQNINALQNATLDMNTNDSGTVTLINNAVIGALTGGRNLNLNASSIFIGNNNASTIYSGALTNSGALTKIGSGTLALSGTNNFAGNTIISAGTLALNGNGSIASSQIVVSGGAMFDVSGLNATFVLGSRTLTNSAVGAIISGTNNCSVGTLSLVNNGTNASFIQMNGTMTISASTVIKVNNTGAILTPGTHPLIVAATTGLVSGALPTVVVTGNGASGTVSLQINGAGGLDLVVSSTVSSSPTSLNFSFGSGTLTLTWPGDHLGWIAQSNAVNLAISNYWFDIAGSQSATNLVIPINPAASNIFYRLRYPF